MNEYESSWIARYERMGALWTHKGSPQQPHALLSSGQHSDGFFNSGIVVEDAFTLDHGAADLVRELGVQNGLTMHVGAVVGPAMGAITLAHAIASCVSKIWSNSNHPCLAKYVEKSTDPSSQVVSMRFTRNPLAKGTHVLLVEDVITTAGSLGRSAQAVVDAGGIVLPWALALVNRSGRAEIDGRKIVSLINRQMSTWQPEECPLCRAGSEAIRPKEAGNWARLNAV